MIILKCTNTRDFMNQFLMKETFDSFLLMEAVVTVANVYTIDGRLQKSFFTKEDWEDQEICPYEFSQWKDMRQMVFQMIKGKHTPVAMKLVLMLKPEMAEKILKSDENTAGEQMVKGLVCSVKYESGSISITTGVSYEGFSMDKTPENVWDKAMMNFLLKAEIGFEEISLKQKGSG